MTVMRIETGKLGMCTTTESFARDDPSTRPVPTDVMSNYSAKLLRLAGASRCAINAESAKRFQRYFMQRIRSLSMSSSTYSLTSTIKLNNGISMPRIHLGVYMTSGRECETAVVNALQAGYLAIDSAEWYANEREVGSAIAKYLDDQKKMKREDLWFTTKLKTNKSYDATRRAVKESIRTSGLGYIDLYLLHSPYGGKKRRLECWQAVLDAVDEGEVRAGGVSNYGVKHVSLVLRPALTALMVDNSYRR